MMKHDPSHCHDVVIVGAGLAGLSSADLLAQAGVSFRLLEARPVAGGRIRSVFDQRTSGFLADLGPSWVWPAFQPLIVQWLDRLGLATFAQFDRGFAVIDHGPNQSAQRQLLSGQDGNRRIKGGSQALIDALMNRLKSGALLTNAAVFDIEKIGDIFNIQTSNPLHPRIKAKKVIIALPPRVARHAIKWHPALPASLATALDQTPTWMAPHAKVAVLYERPFWRDLGLSGRIASRAGPIVEAHDHCSSDRNNCTHAALWGFIGWPHTMRRDIGDGLTFHIEEQLHRCFGPTDAGPLSIHIEDWSKDPLVASPADLSAPMYHPNIGPSVLRQGHFDNALWLAASETATRSPGLIEGAIDAAETAVNALLATV